MSYTDDTLIGDNKFHAYVMRFGGNHPVDQLKIVAQPDQMGFPAGMPQKSVIKTLAVADTVTGQIKGNSGNNNQVGLVGLVVATGGAGFQNSEAPLGKTPQSLNLSEHHAVITDGRIKHPLTCCECFRQNVGGIGLVVGRRIQGNTACPREFLK